MLSILALLLIVLAVTVITVAVAALALVAGSGLAHIFAVNVFEATLIVLAVGAAVIWLASEFIPRVPSFLAEPDTDEAEVDDAGVEDRGLFVTTLPPRSLRRQRRRKK
jgi:hypothetical protein